MEHSLRKAARSYWQSPTTATLKEYNARLAQARLGAHYPKWLLDNLYSGLKDIIDVQYARDDFAEKVTAGYININGTLWALLKLIDRPRPLFVNESTYVHHSPRLELHISSTEQVREGQDLRTDYRRGVGFGLTIYPNIIRIYIRRGDHTDTYTINSHQPWVYDAADLFEYVTNLENTFRPNPDESLRRGQRRWESEATSEAKAKYLIERMRAGDIGFNRISLAAYLGDEASQLLVMQGVVPEHIDDEDYESDRDKIEEVLAQPLPLNFLVSVGSAFARHIHYQWKNISSSDLMEEALQLADHWTTTGELLNENIGELAQELDDYAGEAAQAHVRNAYYGGCAGWAIYHVIHEILRATALELPYDHLATRAAGSVSDIQLAASWAQRAGVLQETEAAWQRQYLIDRLLG